MTISEAINTAFHSLQSLTPFALLDAEVLLALTLRKPRVFLAAHPEKPLSAKQTRNFFSLIAKRKKGEPIAYLTGERWFYGLRFSVNRHTLIPRPETELLVDLAKKAIALTPKKTPCALIDAGTGSGCIILSLAKTNAGKKCLFFATDILKPALAVAKKNARQLRLAKKTFFLQGDLMSPFLKRPALLKNSKKLIITANLPYLTEKQWEHSPAEVKHYEPRPALDGGRDGLTYYKKLLRQLKKLLRKHPVETRIFCEIDPNQTHAIKTLILTYFSTAHISVHKDLCYHDRVVEIQMS